ncbi:phosphatase PAP2 family protein [Pelomonas cellulosilytica]|uniref:Phosphatase PAP2 family protein n=1 Tax=Pelomonas cellulosilytica TaxID=2906762 RepID=A0ABS8XYS9_9BURK|nr:phosphatase PAP2 family protein [Pelomonas sp. P8]MCE4556458.1 phosphatase PAP2 family protein [Pelomonas sp. P8]
MTHYKRFQIGDWDPDYLDLASQETYFVPQVWGQLVALKPPPGDEEGECVAVARKNTPAIRTPERIRDILDQEKDWTGLVAPVMAVLPGAVPDAQLSQSKKPETWRMIKLALYDLQPGLFFQKALINRARPDRTCDQLPRPVIETPGHPAYPAGHAAQAFSVALLLGGLFTQAPKTQQALLQAAAVVADNRVIAGVHFPSDCEAGRQLALHFVPLLRRNPLFERHVDAARAEWNAAPPA